MKAVVYDKNSNTFSIKQIPIPEPGPDEIRVRVFACALNPVDAKINNWKGGIDASVENVVGGLDVCGEVDAIGTEVTTVAVGQAVLYHGKMFQGKGGFAEYSIHDAFTTVTLDKEKLAEGGNELKIQLAASPCAAWTAYQGIYDQLCLPESSAANGEASIAIIGASGGVGSFALQLAKKSRVGSIVAVCSGKHGDYVRTLGATDVIDYRTEDISAGLKRASTESDGFDYVLDCVGSDTAQAAVDSLRYGGRILPIVSFANFGDLRCFMRSISIAQVSLGGAHSGGLRARKRLLRIGEIVTEMILAGELMVPVTSVIPMEEVGSVLMAMLSANNTGKIVMSLLP